MYPITELLKRILQSEKGKELLDNVPPIYSDGYVALWLFEVIGRELDALFRFLDSYEEQIMPGTASWSLGMWEDALGIRGNRELPDEQRRDAVLNRMTSEPTTPYRLSRIASSVCGFTVKVRENTGTNKFTLDCEGLVSTEMLAKLHGEIDKIKPAHLVYDVSTASVVTSPLNTYMGAGLTMQCVYNLEVTQ